MRCCYSEGCRRFAAHTELEGGSKEDRGWRKELEEVKGKVKINPITGHEDP